MKIITVIYDVFVYVCISAKLYINIFNDIVLSYNYVYETYNIILRHVINNVFYCLNSRATY